MNTPMGEAFRQSLNMAMTGEHTHISPQRVLHGLTAEIASTDVGNDIPTIWQILSHMLFWHDVLICSIAGETIDWRKIQANKTDWPSIEAISKENNWEQTVDAFNQSIDQAKQLAKQEDPSRQLPNSMDSTVGHMLTILAAHNSYHLGQIVLQRKILGSWDLSQEG